MLRHSPLHVRLLRLLAPLLLTACATTPALLAESAPGSSGVAQPAESALEALHAANQARSALASEEAAWRIERDHLQAVVDDQAATITRLTAQRAELERQRDLAKSAAAGGPGAADNRELHASIAQAAASLATGLQELASRMPPGVVSVPASDAGMDEVVRCLDASARAAASVAVDLASAQLGGQQVAVKLLHVSGAAAWWLALDGAHAGSATVRDGHLLLEESQDPQVRQAITEAIAICEGRRPARFVLLPLPAAVPLPTAASARTGAP